MNEIILFFFLEKSKKEKNAMQWPDLLVNFKCFFFSNILLFPMMNKNTTKYTLKMYYILIHINTGFKPHILRYLSEFHNLGWWGRSVEFSNTLTNNIWYSAQHRIHLYRINSLLLFNESISNWEIKYNNLMRRQWNI